MPKDMPKSSIIAEDLYKQIKEKRCADSEIKKLTSELRKQLPTKVFYEVIVMTYKMLNDGGKSTKTGAEYIKLLYAQGSHAKEFDDCSTIEHQTVSHDKKQERKIDYCVGDIFGYCGKAVKIKSIHGDQIEVGEADRTDLGPRSINEMLARAEQLILCVEKSISTTPCLTIMYQVLTMELDYLKVRLEMDADMLKTATSFCFGDQSWVVDYKGWSEKIRKALNSNSIRFDLKTDDVCYHEPAFEYQYFLKKKDELWCDYHEMAEEVIFLLDRMNESIVMPNTEKILNIYNSLYNHYLLRQDSKDRDEYKVFKVGVPKCNMTRALNEKRMDLESELKTSGFFDGFGDDPVSACHILQDAETGEWDKESLGRHIFGHKKTLTEEKVFAFFRYMTLMELIQKDYPQEDKKPVKKSVPVISTPENYSITPTGKQILSEILSSVPNGGSLNLTVNLVNGDQVAHKDANIDKNFGTIISTD